MTISTRTAEERRVNFGDMDDVIWLIALGRRASQYPQVL